VPDLIAKPPLPGQEPLHAAGCTLATLTPGPITSVAPFRGQEKALAKALKALGLAFPEPGQIVSAGAARLVWTGRGQAFLLGAAPDGLAPHAALTDQTDGWAALSLEGAGAEAVLARIVPVDVRASAFPPGRSARVPFNHMASVLMRTGPETFEVLVFRSMARTAWHEVGAAMAARAARQRIA
jgi:sarcosine oxidase subunit gamma